MVLKDMFELNDVRITQRLVNFNFGDQLTHQKTTFCFARDLLSELFAMILAAEIFLLSKLVTS